ncbi:HWE histidine kinase domain-containing protein [Phenylobacterium sp.]|uniref:sensor histidine kinase n=1 Tax=Phenylobacterium sp. TaxID=1871053 RepID=UPI0028A09A1B|nr:HWE histidine kinase domain-containing protein [Phenylobacterium sp.]
MDDVGGMPVGDAGVYGRHAVAEVLLRRAFQSWENLLERLPIGVYVCDRKGVVAHFNRRAAELWGAAPSPAGRPIPFDRAFHADGAAMTPEQSPVSETLATGAAVKDREVVIVQPDGRRTHVLANVEPLYDEGGRLIGAINCLQDVTELRQAREMLRARQAWTQRVVETSPIAIYQTDPEGRVLSFNHAAVTLWGREPKLGEDRWCGSHKLYEPEGAPLPLDRCSMAQAIKERRQIAGAEAVFERPDGSRGAFLAYPTPLAGADGELVGAINMLVDITERKRAEDLQKTLLDELNHRVKNTLATVQSLAAHSFHDAGDLVGMRQAFEARLMALSGAHNRLAEQRWEAADLGDLVAGVLAPFGAEAALCEGPAVRLSTRASVTFAMVLHELATNAGCHGALSSSEGRLLVHWTRVEDVLFLEWRETQGPPAAQPARCGFGLRFIRGAVERELDGQVVFDFADSGLRCRISAPISATV